MRYTLGKPLRIKHRGDFTRAFQAGARSNDARLTVLAIPNALARTRVGVAVGGRHGNAVRRNHIKRLCREAFRLNQHELPPGWDLILIPRAGREMSLADLSRSLIRQAGRAIATWQSRGGPGS